MGGVVVVVAAEGVPRIAAAKSRKVDGRGVRIRPR
jgi:hypothetical protein